MWISPLVYPKMFKVFGRHFHKRAKDLLSQYGIEDKNLIVGAAFARSPYYASLLPGNRYIVFSCNWFSLLVAADNNADIVAYKRLIGHEYGHIHCWNRQQFPETDKFCCAKVEEVYADFYGCVSLLNGSREHLVLGLRRIVELRHKDRFWKDTGDVTHPTFEQRIFYAEHFDWSPELVSSIIRDAKITTTREQVEGIFFSFPALPSLH